MPLITCALAIFFIAVPGYGQLLSFGIKAGVPLTDAYNAGFSGYLSTTSYNRQYIIGPTVEVHLPFRLSFEADALYRRNGFDLVSTNLPIYNLPPTYARDIINDWQFPLLAKYELTSGPLRPFVDAGLTYRHVSTSGTSPSTPANPSTAGFTVGGGVSLHAFILRLSPEIRYTHWASEPFSLSNFSGILRSTDNQADILLGLTF